MSDRYSIMVPTHGGESDGRCTYEIRYDVESRDLGGGDSEPVPSLHIIERPDGITTSEIEEFAWMDYDERMRV
jgi:hypothetical protein